MKNFPLKVFNPGLIFLDQILFLIDKRFKLFYLLK
nr:MAG TPA: hypothetical protein [Caudoviricetes sp.]